MNFEFFDSLMSVCEDSVDAYDVASSFVEKDNEKHMLFCRLYKKASGSPLEKANSARTEAIDIWEKYTNQNSITN